MNSVAARAVRGALANVEDNLYRYRHFGSPDTLTGNGVPFSTVIADLERERDELVAALRELEGASERSES